MRFEQKQNVITIILDETTSVDELNLLKSISDCAGRDLEKYKQKVREIFADLSNYTMYVDKPISECSVCEDRFSVQLLKNREDKSNICYNCVILSKSKELGL